MNHETALVVVASNLGIEFPILVHFFYIFKNETPSNFEFTKIKKNINKVWVNGEWWTCCALALLFLSIFNAIVCENDLKLVSQMCQKKRSSIHTIANCDF